jgi:hypothetical protein
MFELNETTGSPNLQEKVVWKLDKKCQRLEFIPFKDKIPYMEERTTQEILIGSIEELYNEIEKSVQAGFQKEKKSF